MAMNLATKSTKKVLFQKEELWQNPIELSTALCNTKWSIQTRINGQGSPELALKMNKKKERKIDNLNSWPRCEQCIFMDVLGLDR